jgi:hypothetical protein
MRKGKDPEPDPDPYLRLIDLDPGGPKTCGSSGSGSPTTEVNLIFIIQVGFVIHNLPVIAKMAAVGKACGNMFQLQQGNSAETSGGLLICLPRYHLVGCSISFCVF